MARCRSLLVVRFSCNDRIFPFATFPLGLFSSRATFSVRMTDDGDKEHFSALFTASKSLRRVYALSFATSRDFAVIVSSLIFYENIVDGERKRQSECFSEKQHAEAALECVTLTHSLLVRLSVACSVTVSFVYREKEVEWSAVLLRNREMRSCDAQLDGSDFKTSYRERVDRMLCKI